MFETKLLLFYQVTTLVNKDIGPDLSSTYTHILILRAFTTIPTKVVRFINVILSEYSGDPSGNTETNNSKIDTVFSYFIYTIYNLTNELGPHCA